MKNWNDILTNFKTPRDLADVLGCEYQAARKMLERKRVASRHWPKLISGLSALGKTITAAELAALAADNSPRLSNANAGA